ncbi:MAG TPA: GNAT family N-acetyltransferase [Candidatus Nanopelagicales bacterium]|nr:GNAT family N-acetyltransferase [Candidatus Nanopelagicales bacterium]
MTTSPDASVRPARETDAPAVAATTLAAWRASYAELLPAEVLAGLDLADATNSWRAAIREPGEHRLLVACAGPSVVGYVLVAPDGGPGAQLVELVVRPDQQRRGHGSRLLSAAVTGLREDGVTSVVAWTDSEDAARASFLTSAGFAADGTSRTLDLDGTGTTTVRQLRWSALLA